MINEYINDRLQSGVGTSVFGGFKRKPLHRRQAEPTAWTTQRGKGEYSESSTQPAAQATDRQPLPGQSKTCRPLRYS